ncbi:MAG: ADP-heptose:LPS heptosyltransferase [candidate division TM6 bacterium GW2011_GWF2_37_49]|nr:MAG: ADP-heptose:LPS heptosyltransferase [candidate division TM6 bacterium GW2011_GWF2_37_49]
MQHISPTSLLQSIERILFVMDLSVRDLIYFQSYLTDFARIYPQTKFDLMIKAREHFFLTRNKSFQIKVLKDVFKEQRLISNIYFDPSSSQKLIRQAQSMKYQSIVLLDKNAQTKNIELAIKINPKSSLIGTTTKTKWYNVLKKRAYKSLNFSIEVTPHEHAELNNFYASIFSYLNGKDVKLKPLLNIPKKWVIYAKLRFMKWGINKKNQDFGRVFFINPFDDDCNCVCPLKNLFNAIITLKQQDEWGDVTCILHTPPQKFYEVKRFFADHSVNNLFLLSADYDFFQIPAILSLCDAVFSVDGLCVDLASALNVQAFAIDKLNNIKNNE